MKKILLSEKELFEDLYQRLVDNYNNGTPFEQYEEDRLIIGHLLDFLDKK